MSNDFRNSRLSPEVRASALVEQMTLDEKCRPIVGVRPWVVTKPDGSEATGISTTYLHTSPGRIAGLAGPRRAPTGAQRSFLSEAVVSNA